MFKIIKGYYKKKLYTKEQIAKFVSGGTITAEQYQEITGGEYVPVKVSSVIKELQTKTAEVRAAVYFNSELTAKRLEDAEADIETLKGGSTV